MIDLKSKEVWFLTGTQHLYGDKTLEQVAVNARAIATYLDTEGKLPVRVVYKPILKGPEAIRDVCIEANAAASCIGVIAWMHTFSPAKMWIAGLTRLDKPLAHLHTQYNREIPWNGIDMDFMNLNQSAHGDREFGFIGARLRINRKIVVGHWQDKRVRDQLEGFVRVAAAYADARQLKIARFGGMNMRDVAVTGGDRVEAQIQLGWSINGYGVGDLVENIAGAGNADVDATIAQYESQYALSPVLRRGGARHESLREAARQEVGMRRFLEQGGFDAFTTTFEDLHGLTQLPGLACQRLMAEGYGFGAEGDWKTAGLVRAMKVMAHGLKGGVSFMEDYTYHLAPDNELVLGAHMLEICPSVAADQPSLEIHPLGIGGKDDPCRLVFEAAPGPAINASLVDMGGRMRLIAAELDVVRAPQPMPKLPVARALWRLRPDFERGCHAWILCGGAHHAGFAQALVGSHLEDFAAMAGVECIRIGSDTDIKTLQQELFWNDAAYRLAPQH